MTEEIIKEQLLKISLKVQAAIDKGYKKKNIAQIVGLSKPTFNSRLKDNGWQLNEISLLRRNGII